MKAGKVVQIIGPVVDVEFTEETLPSLYNAIEIKEDKINLTMEVMQHLGGNMVRCVALASTDGLQGGMKAIEYGFLHQSAGRTFHSGQTLQCIG